jgi:hypothetical protein
MGWMRWLGIMLVAYMLAFLVWMMAVEVTEIIQRRRYYRMRDEMYEEADRMGR